MKTKAKTKAFLTPLELGKQLMQEGKLDEAIVLFRKALNKPNSPLSEVYYRLGEALAKKNQVDEAISSYHKVIELDPNYSWSYHNLGEILATQGQVDEAIASYRKAIELNPTISWSYYRLGEALGKQDRLREAIASYRKAIELDPKFFWSNQNLGEALAKEGQLDEAISCYHKAIELNPNIPWSYLHLGETLAAKGQFGKAFDSYRQAIELHPEFSGIKDKLAAIEINPDSAESCYQLGNLWEKLGQINAATTCYQKAIQIAPSYVEPHWRFHYLLHEQRIQPSKIEGLIALYREVIQRQPNFPLVWGILGDALTEGGKLDEAVKYYQIASNKQVIKSKPNLGQAEWNSSKEKKPDFIIIGSAKCGTTSLYHYLNSHPQILPGYRKEIEFFSHQYKFERGASWYLSHFPSIADSPEFITGEASPSYLDLPNVDQRVFQLFPDVKLIVMLRNPVERTISQYSHRIKFNNEKRTLEELICAELEQLEDPTLGITQPGNYWRLDCIAGSLYVYKLKRWMSLFAKEQFLILNSDEFYANTSEVMQQVFSFLGLPEHYSSEFEKKHNRGSHKTSASDADRNTLVKYFQPHNQQLEDYLGMKFNWD